MPVELSSAGLRGVEYRKGIVTYGSARSCVGAVVSGAATYRKGVVRHYPVKVWCDADQSWSSFVRAL